MGLKCAPLTGPKVKISSGRITCSARALLIGCDLMHGPHTMALMQEIHHAVDMAHPEIFSQMHQDVRRLSCNAPLQDLDTYLPTSAKVHTAEELRSTAEHGSRIYHVRGHDKASI